MNRQLTEQYIGIPVKIAIGEKMFSPPPGIIETVSDDYFTFKTTEKTSVIALSELKGISPVTSR